MTNTPSKARRARITFGERPTCSLNEAAHASGLSRSFLYTRMRKGDLEFVKLGSRRLVKIASLLKLLGLAA